MTAPTTGKPVARPKGGQFVFNTLNQDGPDNSNALQVELHTTQASFAEHVGTRPGGPILLGRASNHTAMPSRRRPPSEDTRSNSVGQAAR